MDKPTSALSEARMKNPGPELRGSPGRAVGAHLQSLLPTPIKTLSRLAASPAGILLLFLCCTPNQSYGFRNCTPEEVKKTIGNEEIRAIFKRYRDWLKSINALQDDGSVSGYDLDAALFKNPSSQPATFCNVDFSKTSSLKELISDFTGLDFSYSNLSKADLNTHLHDVSFRGSCLVEAQFTMSGIWGVDFSHTNLTRANFNKTNISGGSSFSDSLLYDTDFTDSNTTYIDLSNAVYMTASDPITAVALIGLENATWSLRGNETFDADPCGFTWTNNGSLAYGDTNPYSLLRFRKYTRDKGLYDDARRLTVAIENGKLSEYLHSDSIFDKLYGVTRFVTLGLTTSYGLYPSRALLLIVGNVMAFSFIYWYIIATRHNSNETGIYRMLPDDRIMPCKGGYKLLKKKAQIVRLNWRRAYPYALLFSAASAFQIGWKDINIGAWISRLQTREFSLVARGWVRSVSGIQTLISLGLLVLWILSILGILVD
jgi:hypothetical protein